MLSGQSSTAAPFSDMNAGFLNNFAHFLRVRAVSHLENLENTSTSSSYLVVTCPMFMRQSSEALRRVRNSRDEKTDARRHSRQIPFGISSVYSDAEHEMAEDEDISQRHRGMHVSLSREERQMVLAGTRNDTEYRAIVTQLRSACDDQDLPDRDTGGKNFGKSHTLHFPKTDTEWYAEQIAHSVSGDAAELDVTWSFDPDEAMWWCGLLDPSILEPDMMDWSEDWSYSESSPCAEDVFPEQSQVLALTSDDLSSPERVQQAEVLVAEANRTLAQARSAVASEKQNRIGFCPLSNVPSSRKGKAKGKLKGKSKDSSCVICGRSGHFSRKDLAKEVKMDFARFTWEPHGVLILNCLRLLCFKRMLSWTVVRQKQLVSKQCRFCLML